MVVSVVLHPIRGPSALELYYQAVWSTSNLLHLAFIISLHCLHPRAATLLRKHILPSPPFPSRTACSDLDIGDLVVPPCRRDWHSSHLPAIKQLSTEIRQVSTEVLETYELLESIPFNLSPENFFVLQKVSARWRALIRRSHGLQKKMFLKAIGKVSQPRIKPFYGFLGKQEEFVYDRSVQLNPMIYAMDAMGNCKRECEITRHEGKTAIIEVPLEKYDKEQSSVRLDGFCSDAMFGMPDMLLTRPPISGLTCSYDEEVYGGHIVWNSHGIALRDLIDSMRGVFDLHVTGKSECSVHFAEAAALSWEIKVDFASSEGHVEDDG